MFERYKEVARRVIFHGRYEAVRADEPYIEPHHLLLALYREAHRMMDRLAPQSRERARSTFAQEAPGKRNTNVDLPLSNASKRVLAYAAKEAERLGDYHIDGEHLLLGILLEKECRAAEFLNEVGVTLSGVREKLAGQPPEAGGGLYCPRCAREVPDPLTCGDCSAVICRVCGSPLESPDEMATG